jgi:hypothetical protein
MDTPRRRSTKRTKVESTKLFRDLGFMICCAAPLSETDFRDLNRDNGLYILEFDDDTFYVGISKQIGVRLRTHWKTGKANGCRRIHIRQFTGAQKDLLALERYLIGLLEESGNRLRNRDGAAAPLMLEGDALSKLPWIPEDAKKWLKDVTFTPLGIRKELDKLRRRNEETFRYFSKLRYAERALMAMLIYIKKFLPLPWEGEGILWNVCFRQRGDSVTICVSVHRQESLYLLYDRKREKWNARLTVTNSMVRIENVSKGGLQVDFWRQKLKSAGHDQVSIRTASLKTLMAVLEQSKVVLAGRDLVLRCMRKGVSQWARNHHPWVVDAALAVEAGGTRHSPNRS